MFVFMFNHRGWPRTYAWSDASCKCDICKLQKLKHNNPMHLKACDDTAGKNGIGYMDRESPALSWSSMIPFQSGCDCGCDGCVERRSIGKTPKHLKAHDNTNSAHVHAHTLRHTISAGCLEHCLACRAPIDASLDRGAFDGYRDHPMCLGCRSSGIMFGWPDVRRCLFCELVFYPVEADATTTSADEEVYDEIVLLEDGFGVDYANCTPKALKHIVQKRNLQDPFPSGLTLKCYYIRVLEAADQPFRFQFMNLPGELRNLVYNELLILNPWRYDSHPQILATCSEINTDATSILYGDNSLDCDFIVKYDNLKDYKAELELAKQYKTVASWWDEKDANLNDLVLPLESQFHKISGLEITIKLEGAGRISAYQETRFEDRGMMQNMILAFTSSLMDNHKLRKVHINFDSDDLFNDGWTPFTPVPQSILDLKSEWAESILYPFRRLRNIGQVEITGTVSPDLAEEASSEMQGDSPVFNIWKELDRVQARMENYIDFVHMHHLEDFAGRWEKFDEFLFLANMPHENLDPNNSLIADAEHETEVRALLVEQEEMLEVLGPVELLIVRLSQMG